MFHQPQTLQYDWNRLITPAHEEVLQDAFVLFVVNCSSMAARTWLFWDFLITFQKEVDIVWQMKWTFAKFLYFFTRYCGIISQVASLWLTPSMKDFRKEIGKQHCSHQSMTGRLTIVAALKVAMWYVLLLRVYALYFRHGLLRKLLRGLFLLITVAMSAPALIYISEVEYDDPTCSSLNSNHGLLLYCISTLLFQLLFLFLTLAKYVQEVKSGWGVNPIITLLARDSLWGFCLIFASNVIYLLLRFAHSSLQHLVFNWTISIYSFVGYRSLLNIFTLSFKARMDPWLASRPTVNLTKDPARTLTLDEYDSYLGVASRDD